MFINSVWVRYHSELLCTFVHNCVPRNVLFCVKSFKILRQMQNNKLSCYNAETFIVLFLILYCFDWILMYGHQHFLIFVLLYYFILISDFTLNTLALYIPELYFVWYFFSPCIFKFNIHFHYIYLTVSRTMSSTYISTSFRSAFSFFISLLKFVLRNKILPSPVMRSYINFFSF